MANFEFLTALQSIPASAFYPGSPVGEAYIPLLAKAANSVLAYHASPLCIGQVFGSVDARLELPPQPGLHGLVSISVGVGWDLKLSGGATIASGTTPIGTPAMHEWSDKLGDSDWLELVLLHDGQYRIFPYAPSDPALTIADELTGYIRDIRYAAGRGLTVGLMNKMMDAIIKAWTRRRVLATILYDAHSCKTGTFPILSNASYQSRGTGLGFSAHVVTSGNPSLRLTAGSEVVTLALGANPAGAVKRSTTSGLLPDGEVPYTVEAIVGAGDALVMHTLSVYEGEVTL